MESEIIYCNDKDSICCKSCEYLIDCAIKCVCLGEEECENETDREPYRELIED